MKNIEKYLYQLVDVSRYIGEVSDPKCLSENYDFYSNILTCACIEEKFIIKELENHLNYIFHLNTNKRFLNNKISISTSKRNRLNNHHYYFNIPIRRLNQSSKEFIFLTNTFNEIKKNTKDIDYYTRSYEDKWVRLFRLQVRHKKFITENWLKDKKIKVEFI